MQDNFEIINKIIKTFKVLRHDHNYIGLVESALALLEYTPSLIEYSVEQESEYRKFEAKLTNESIGEKKLTSSYCDTQAKGTEEYKEWQKSKLYLELIYEMVNIAKKLANTLDKDYIALSNK